MQVSITTRLFAAVWHAGCYEESLVSITRIRLAEPDGLRGVYPNISLDGGRAFLAGTYERTTFCPRGRRSARKYHDWVGSDLGWNRQCPDWICAYQERIVNWGRHGEADEDEYELNGEHGDSLPRSKPCLGGFADGEQIDIKDDTSSK